MDFLFQIQIEAYTHIAVVGLLWFHPSLPLSLSGIDDVYCNLLSFLSLPKQYHFLHFHMKLDWSEIDDDDVVGTMNESRWDIIDPHAFPEVCVCVTLCEPHITTSSEECVHSYYYVIYFPYTTHFFCYIIILLHFLLLLRANWTFLRLVTLPLNKEEQNREPISLDNLEAEWKVYFYLNAHRSPSALPSYY